MALELALNATYWRVDFAYLDEDGVAQRVRAVENNPATARGRAEDMWQRTDRPVYCAIEEFKVIARKRGVQ